MPPVERGDPPFFLCGSQSPSPEQDIITIIIVINTFTIVTIVKGTVAKSSLTDALEFTQWTVVKSPQKRYGKLSRKVEARWQMTQGTSAPRCAFMAATP